MISEADLEYVNALIAPAPSDTYYVNHTGDWWKANGSPMSGMPCSTMRQDNGMYLYVIDIDAPNNEDNARDAALTIVRHNPEIREPPFQKFSSTKGFHLIWHVDTCGMNDEASIMDYFRCMPSRIYHKLELSRYGITMGSKQNNMDISIYRNNGVVKLCGNNGHGRFAVPINLEADTLTSIFNKSIGKIPFHTPDPPEVLQFTNIPLLESSRNTYIKKKSTGSNNNFSALMKREFPPDMLWACTRYLYFEERLKHPELIYEYYKRNANWFRAAMRGKDKQDVIKQIQRSITTAARKDPKTAVPEWLYEV